MVVANNLVILHKLDEHGKPTGRATVKGMLEHSKTEFKRYVNALGLSQGPAAVPLVSSSSYVTTVEGVVHQC